MKSNIKPVTNNSITIYVPRHVPKSFPSDTFFTWACPKPRDEKTLNIEIEDNANPIAPRAATDASPQSFARINAPAMPRKSIKKVEITIKKDLRAIIIFPVNKKDIYNY